MYTAYNSSQAVREGLVQHEEHLTAAFEGRIRSVGSLVKVPTAT